MFKYDFRYVIQYDTLIFTVIIVTFGSGES